MARRDFDFYHGKDLRSRILEARVSKPAKNRKGPRKSLDEKRGMGFLPLTRTKEKL
jgi:hypothetical protein